MQSTDRQVVNIPRHFYSLDALRGLAALGIIFWHWPHFFFYGGTNSTQFDITQQPLYGLFKPLYTNGWRAVDLFFCLSGFIFFWLYSAKISRRETSLKEFFILRLSRLYPLHFAALLFVAVGQQLMFWRSGKFFIYQYNDFFHFVLQSLFASHWGWESGDSFNGPGWSVSIEILLYAIFFGICRLNLLRWWHLALFVTGGFILMAIGNHALLGRGLVSFFVGGISFYIFYRILQLSLSLIVLQGLGATTACLWVLIPIDIHDNILYHFYRDHFWQESLNFRGKDLIGTMLMKGLAHISFELLLFPLTIITLALWESKRGTLGRRLAFLGQISYSSYLLHFPLQLVIVHLAMSFSIANTFFRTPIALISFFAILIPLSLCSYHFFERPCQSFLRSYCSPRPPKPPSTLQPAGFQGDYWTSPLEAPQTEEHN
jgi:peptidoglycan/LPS O-acetylase OafA/YrhL